MDESMTLWARDNIILNVAGERSSPIPAFPVTEKELDELIQKYKYFAEVRRRRSINARKIVNALLELKKYREKSNALEDRLHEDERCKSP
jgi:hypothetical protein